MLRCLLLIAALFTACTSNSVVDAGVEPPRDTGADPIADASEPIDATEPEDATVEPDAAEPVDAGPPPDAGRFAACACPAEANENCRGCFDRINTCCFAEQPDYDVAGVSTFCASQPACAACCNECAAMDCAEMLRRYVCPFLPPRTDAGP